MNVTILTDNKKSWFVIYGQILQAKLKELEHNVNYVFHKKEILTGDICFLLSCSKIIEDNFLKRNEYNIVVHSSNLPEGKGFSPLQWQIIEGKNEITLSLFEAVKDVDAGPIYFKDKIIFNGSELYLELREALAKKIIEMCVYFVENVKSLKPTQQNGKESFYKRRSIKDDKIDINKTIREQFNHFRIADNENHPLWFEYKDCKYIITIQKKINKNEKN